MPILVGSLGVDKPPRAQVTEEGGVRGEVAVAKVSPQVTGDWLSGTSRWRGCNGGSEGVSG